MEMQDLGMMLHPCLAVGFSWRRNSPGRRQPLPAIRPISPEAMEIPMQAWPSTWEGLVEHMRQGGSFRVDGRLRGGMDPGLQAVLDQTVFDNSIPWDTLEECFTMVRSGSELRDEVSEGTRLLSQALVAACALNQWSNIRQLPPETLARSTATALRLKESELKKLMPRRNEHLEPVAIMNPAVQLVTGQAAEGTGSAAGAPDNPEAARHKLYTTVNAS